MDILNTKNATSLGRNMNTRKLLERKVRQHGDKPFIIFLHGKRDELTSLELICLSYLLPSLPVKMASSTRRGVE